MTSKIKIALAQLNPKLGDVASNVMRLSKTRRNLAAVDEVDLILAPELVISGYPPEDLALKPAFQDACRNGVETLAVETADGGPAIIVGAPWIEDGKLLNGAFLLGQGKILAKRFKHDLPNYGVFDEKRVFAAGPLPQPIKFKNLNLGLLICEDLWFAKTATYLKESGAELLLVPNGSPYDYTKPEQRLEIASCRQDETNLPIIYVNQVGGQDELVFDGDSFVLDRGKTVKVRLPAFEEKIVVTEWHKGNDGWSCSSNDIVQSLQPMESIYRAMVLGLKDYVEKNNFPGVILGLSGGIDSALSAAVAVDAIGPDKVRAFMMPSPYTSQASLDDAKACAQLLGIQCDIISIEPAMLAFDGMLSGIFAGKDKDTTEENIQSRARGLSLMAISNKLGHMLLTTGNKSEMSVGYATLYGDMCGGYSVLKDIYKVTVFALSRWRNTHFPFGMMGPQGPIMPDCVITKPPSAELKPNQTDQDTLPPYDVLDGILTCLVENEMAVDQIVAKGYDRATVLRIWRMLDLAEYKRRQAPPGVKISRRAFGKDRRYPITNGFLPNKV